MLFRSIATKAPKKVADSLDMPTKAEIANIRDNDSGLMQFANAAGAPSEGDIYTKAMAIYKDRVNDMIVKTSEKRNKLLTDYFVTRMNVPATNFSIETISIEQGKTYSNKNVFKTGFSLPGEEPVAPETAEALN